jgi:hypothetical protein
LAVPIRECGEEHRMRKCKKLKFIIAILLAAYLSSYLWLSRRGYAEADQYHMKGFYYFFPEDSDAWRRKNYACVYLFWPLNAVDQSLGIGRDPAYEPLWRLSK